MVRVTLLVEIFPQVNKKLTREIMKPTKYQMIKGYDEEITADFKKLAIQEEVSIRDMSESEVEEIEERNDQIFYDASDELDEFE